MTPNRRSCPHPALSLGPWLQKWACCQRGQISLPMMVRETRTQPMRQQLVAIPRHGGSLFLRRPSQSRSPLQTLDGTSQTIVSTLWTSNPKTTRTKADFMRS